MKNEGMLKPALVGAVAMGTLTALSTLTHLDCFCCAWFIGGGVLASYMYVKSSQLPATLGRGAGLGLLTGVLGTLVCALFSIPSSIMNTGNESLANQMRQNLNNMPNLPAESRQMMESLLSGEGFGAFIIFCLFLAFVVISLLSMIGGTIGVALFEKRPSAPPPHEAAHYEPPSNIPPPPPPADPQ